MRNFIVALALVGSMFLSGCTAALLLGAGGAAGYLWSENQDLKEEQKTK